MRKLKAEIMDSMIKDPRIKLTELSKKLSVAVSTIFDNVKEIEKDFELQGCWVQISEMKEDQCDHEDLDETGKEPKCIDCGRKVYWDPVENVVYEEEQQC